MNIADIFLRLSDESDLDSLLNFFKEPLLFKKNYSFEDKQKLSERVLNSLTPNMIRTRKKSKQDPIYIYISKLKKEYSKFPSNFTDQLLYLYNSKENKISQANGFLLFYSNNLANSEEIIKKIVVSIDSNQHYLSTLFNEIPEEKFKLMNEKKLNKNILVDYLLSFFDKKKVYISDKIKTNKTYYSMSVFELHSQKFNSKEDRIYVYLNYLKANSLKDSVDSFLILEEVYKYLINVLSEIDLSFENEVKVNKRLKKEISSKEEIIMKQKNSILKESTKYKNIEMHLNNILLEHNNKIHEFNFFKKEQYEKSNRLKEELKERTKQCNSLNSNLESNQKEINELNTLNLYMQKEYIMIHKNILDLDNEVNNQKDWMIICSKDYEILDKLYPEFLIVEANDYKKQFTKINGDISKIIILTRSMPTLIYKGLMKDLNKLKYESKILIKDFRSLKETMNWIGYQICIQEGIK